MFDKILQISGATIFLLCLIFGYSFGQVAVPGVPDSIDLELGITPDPETKFIWSIALTWWMNGFFWGMVLFALSFILQNTEKEKTEEQTNEKTSV